MWKYICKRIAVLIPLIFLVSFIVYALMDFAPGDPVRSLVGEEMTDEQVEAKREELGLNDPLLVRYGRYIKDVFSGDFGQSLYGGKDVLTEYMHCLPYTFKLSLLALLMIIVISLPLGIIAAVKQNSWIDTIASVMAMVGLSMPSFWVGLILILLFGVRLGWLPTSGIDQGFLSYILPAFTLALTNISLATRTTRSSMLDQIRADYLRTARAKGVNENAVVTKHALKNALIPITTIIGSQFTTMFGGAVVIESVFSWPGIGNLTLLAIRRHDITMATSCAVLTTVITAVILLAVDILYAYIDPRIKAQYSGK